MEIRIRASSLSDYLDCPRRAAIKMFRSNVEQAGYKPRQLENNIAAAIGTATHSGATWSLEEKMKSGELGNRAESEHRALESLKHEQEAGVVYDQTSPDINTAQKQVVRQLNSYRVHIAHLIEPSSVEERLEGQATPSISMTGQCDISENLMTGGIGIRDIKTGTKEKYHGAQLGAYSLLGRAHGKDVKAMNVDYIERVAIGKEQPAPVVIPYSVADTENLTWNILRAVERDYGLFAASGNPETFLPNPSSVLCSAKYCPAFGTEFCKHHAKREHTA